MKVIHENIILLLLQQQQAFMNNAWFNYLMK